MSSSVEVRSTARWCSSPARLGASYNQGVLTLRIPVAEPAKPRKVQISSGKGQAIDAASSRS